MFRLSLMTITTGAMTSDYMVMIGSRNRTMTYDTWAVSMYKGTLSGTKYGSVSATAVLMFIFLAIASLIQFLAMRKIENSVLGGE